MTGAARCNGAALVSMQAGRLSPVPTQTAAEPTTGPDYRRSEYRYRRKPSGLLRCPSVLSTRRDRVTGAARCNGAALVSMQAQLSQPQASGGGRLSPVPTQTAAEPTTGPTTAAVSTDIDENRRVCFGALRCPSVLSTRRDRVTGAARCNGAALGSMQAGRLSPVPTQTAAEPTTGPTTAAVSTDIDENRRVCFGALRC